MSGVRLHSLLASTAIALLLSAGGGALAQSTGAPDNGSVVSTPDGAKDTPAAADQADKASGTAPSAVTTPPDQAGAPAAGATPPAAATTPPDQAEAPAAGATPPAAATPTETVDATITDQLHQLASGKFDRVLGGKSLRAEIEKYYSAHNYAPLWITDGQANDRANAAMKYLGHVDADGLEPVDYPVPDFKSSDASTLAQAELQLTASVVTYARHASIGRIAWSRVDANIDYDTKAPDPASVLAAIAGAQDVAAVLDSYEPHAPGYLALKAKLAEIRAGNGDGLKPPIPNGAVLKVGDQDDRVPALREKLGISGDGTTYDKALAEAVKNFQKEHDLKVTGTLTAPTIDALNGPRPSHVTDIILANMERWRWMPHDLGKFYVMINLPDFTASVFNQGKRIWKTKIVIGKTDMPTPIITTMMKFITVNPTWHVPPSIINREYLPALQQDPTVLQRMGLVVERDMWGKVTGIYQPPGDANAEGRLRFNFPNKFLVYQHDTPDKYMFAYARRAFSHGCMRTQDPAKYAEVLLSLVRPHDGYSEERLKKMFGPSEINIDFPTFIPINVTYQTAFVDDDGKLQLRDDIYGRDRELLAIMKGPERKIADIPVEHKIDQSHRQVMAVPDSTSLWGGGQRGYSSSGEGFFSRLFGSFSQPQPAPRPVARRKVTTRSPGTVAQ
jgi:L,D-transpeptidase YcbB